MKSKIGHFSDSLNLTNTLEQPDFNCRNNIWGVNDKI